MYEQDIKNKLHQLALYRTGRAAIDLQKQELIDQVLTPEIKGKIVEIEAEFAGKTVALENNITELEKSIKEAVIANGQTVKGMFLQAVYAKGRISWDNKGLDGYTVAHPEIGIFRKEGEPSVSIRSI